MRLNDQFELSQFTQDSGIDSPSVVLKSAETQRSIQYRADIDGLRAIAILIVVLFHAFPHTLPGGFIGVDIFFVISGFLISGIIIKQNQKQKFTFLQFYIRRIKRIYPALILVLIFALYIIKKLADNFSEVRFELGTLDASLIFGANLQILTHEKGYFDDDIHGNSLLHLWSLGVEEQFYIIWPCLLLFTLKFSKSKSLKILVFYTVACFVCSIFAVYKNPKFAFYFPFCRFWQMSIGGILALMNFRIHNTKFNEALTSVGLLGIFITVWTINDQSLFPGFWALVPTLSAACIIQAGTNSTINRAILSSKPFVFVGKISYSLYLWHWPLLVYSRSFYPSGSTSIFANTSFILFLTLVVTILTYYILEDPIRKSRKSWLAIVLIVCMVAIGVTSFLLKLRIVDYDSYLDMNDEEFAKLFKKFDEQMIPGPNDYYMKDGKLVPNFSINKDRLKPDFMKTRAALIGLKYDNSHGGTLMLEKGVDASSKYSNISIPDIHMLQVTNEGRQNQLFLIGDSHARSIAYRFQKLYEDTKKDGTQDSFPTVLAAISLARPLVQSSTILNVTRQLVAKFKPQRILFACNWQGYICKDFCSDMNKPANCDQQKADRYITEFVQFATQIRSKGVQVSTTGIDIDLEQLHPGNMFDFNGIIEKNVKPFKYSEYRSKYDMLINKFQTAMKTFNIPIIDLAQNFCWEDLCYPTSATGYAAYLDCEHLNKFYSRNWLSSLNHLVQF